MKDKLKPHVYKVKGKSAFALYDLLNGNLFHLIPTGTIESTREFLQKHRLIFETDDTVPFPVELDITDKSSKIHLKELQIKLGGFPEETCRNRNPKPGLPAVMPQSILNQIELKTRNIPLQKIRVETHSPEFDSIHYIITRFQFEILQLHIQSHFPQSLIQQVEALCRSRKIEFILNPLPSSNLFDSQFDITQFFYSHQFNPCQGHQIAVDCLGEIKPCLWSSYILGNIETHDLQEMIIAGDFDSHWEISKDKIEGCNQCEKRYACSDCRVSAQKYSGKMTEKPLYCDYDSV